jgi:hypothetical protein
VFVVILDVISTIFQLYRGGNGGILLLEETGVPGENHRPVAYHIMLYRVRVWRGFI